MVCRASLPYWSYWDRRVDRLSPRLLSPTDGCVEGQVCGRSTIYPSEAQSGDLCAWWGHHLLCFSGPLSSRAPFFNTAQTKVCLILSDAKYQIMGDNHGDMTSLGTSLKCLWFLLCLLCNTASCAVGQGMDSSSLLRKSCKTLLWKET